MKKIPININIVLLVLVIIAGYYLNNGLLSKNITAKIEIPRGSSTSYIADTLQNAGVIKSAFIFKMLSKVTNNSKNYKPGTLMLNSKMSYGTIMSMLIHNANRVTITIPEGYELVQIADVLEANKLINRDTFFKEIAEGNFDFPYINENLPKGENRLEGYLFPDTYLIDEDTSEHDIINMMLKNFLKVYTPKLSERAKELGYSDHEIITLASIIEREGKTDRDIISSVFQNRIKSKDFKYLQSCATVLYITKKPKPRLDSNDIKIDSPYNTYVNKGLPPGPIGAPGKESIMATLYPAKTDYYYFSAMPDGTNTFSKTYEEHISKQG